MKPFPRTLVIGLVAFALGACASKPPASAPSKPVALATSAAEVEPSASAMCELVLDRPRVDEPDHHARAVENAESVLREMERDLLACYEKRVAVDPRAHGYITVDIVIGQEGHVQKTETTGGAILGPATMTCITNRIESARFAPPHGGGTLRVHVPFALRRVLPGEAP